jgi:hypothetical protein
VEGDAFASVPLVAGELFVGFVLVMVVNDFESSETETATGSCRGLTERTLAAPDDPGRMEAEQDAFASAALVVGELFVHCVLMVGAEATTGSFRGLTAGTAATLSAATRVLDFDISGGTDKVREAFTFFVFFVGELLIGFVVAMTDDFKLLGAEATTGACRDRAGAGWTKGVAPWMPVATRV